MKRLSQHLSHLPSIMLAVLALVSLTACGDDEPGNSSSSNASIVGYWGHIKREFVNINMNADEWADFCRWLGHDGSSDTVVDIDSSWHPNAYYDIYEFASNGQAWMYDCLDGVVKRESMDTWTLENGHLFFDRSSKGIVETLNSTTLSFKYLLGSGDRRYYEVETFVRLSALPSFWYQDDYYWHPR